VFSVCYQDRVTVTTLVAKDGLVSMAEWHISLPKTFLGADAPADWFQCFEICLKANGWDTAMKAGKLPTLFEGEALSVWLELTTEQQDDYAIAKKEIQSVMMPMRFITMDEFH